MAEDAARRDLVVVGASAGGVEALQSLVSSLPADTSAAVCVVLHMPPRAASALPRILARAAALPVAEAADDQHIVPGRIYVCRPDHHLLIHDGHLRLGRGPRENGHRPAVDTLFRSAARWRGGRAVGVILSGSLDDGAAGAGELERRGGVVVVQEPATAMYAGMPTACIESTQRAMVLPLDEIGPAIVGLCAESISSPTPPASDLLVLETDMAEFDVGALQDPDRPGTPVGMTCPDCSGSLFEIASAGQIRYRCRVGHAWSARSLVAEQDEVLENALWMALRSLEDKAALHRRMAGAAEDGGQPITAERSRSLADEAQGAAAVIRNLLIEERPAAVAEG
jgi:two-component system chemotaxis response regulator CheB